VPQEPHNIQQLLQRIESAAGDGDPVRMHTIVEEVGRRSFGGLLLLAGVIGASPLSGIPAMPTTIAVIVLVVSVQLLLGRDGFWLPQWVLERSIARSKVDKALSWLRPPARLIDRFLRPRAMPLVHGAGAYVIALVCAFIAVGVPVLELAPFAATVGGAAIALFGLALISRDGTLAVLGYIFAAAVYVFAFRNLVT
jgi:hypothetical protein